ncbi:transcription factor S [Nanoarchaeota archaeon]
MIQFCPKCKSILRPKKENDKVIMFCSCGYTSKPKGGSIREEKKKPTEEVDEVPIIEKEIEVLPVAKEECPECGNIGAYYWLVQTRSADEAMTKFLKCTKCKHTWRDYD